MRHHAIEVVDATTKKNKTSYPLYFRLGPDGSDSYLVSSHFLVRRGALGSLAFSEAPVPLFLAPPPPRPSARGSRS